MLILIFANLLHCSDAFTTPRSTAISSTINTRIHDVTILHSSSNNNNGDDDNTFEIFYDDFAGPIGDVISPSSSQLSSSAALQTSQEQQQQQQQDEEEEEELPEFTDNESSSPNNNSKELISIPLPTPSTQTIDLTGALSREFSLGRDLLLSDYAGSLGFDQVTDWQYYTTDLSTGKREDRAANPFDPNQPSRTRSRSGRVVRLFRGEFTGRIGNLLRSRGLDSRVILKEFAVDIDDDDDDMLLNLAKDEQRSLAKLQSNWLQGYCMTANNNAQQLLEQLENGEWNKAAQRRYVDGLTDTPTTADDEHLVTLLECTSSKKAPFTSILGQLNLNDYYDDEDMDPNEWYKSLGVVSDSSWLDCDMCAV